MAHGGGVAEFSGKAVMAINDFTIDHYTGAYAGSEGDHDEILHASGGAVSHFTHGCGVGIIGKGHGNAVHLLAQEL